VEIFGGYERFGGGTFSSPRGGHPVDDSFGLLHAGAMMRVVSSPSAAVSVAPGLGVSLGGWRWSAFDSAGAGGTGWEILAGVHVDASVRARLAPHHLVFVSPGVAVFLPTLTAAGASHDASHGLGWFDLTNAVPRDYFGMNAVHATATLDLGYAFEF
jgi:hypothetical protein